MASIQGIYVALFGRPADPAGLAFFNEATSNGADLTAIGDLAATTEYQSRFAGMTNEQIVNSIYQSLFERDGEKDGIDFYVGELEAGRLNINNIAIAILDGAKNDDLATVNAKIAAADIFTSHLDLNAEIAAYNGTFAAQVGREFLDTVTKDDPGTADEADTAILRLFPDQGQTPGGGGGGGGVSFGDKSYGDGDILLLNNSTVEHRYYYNDYDPENQQNGFIGAASAVYHDAIGNEEVPGIGNTVLVQNMDPINEAIGSQIDVVANVVKELLPSYEGWRPDALFVGIPGHDSTITGTAGNDVALVLDGSQFDHTVTGGRGNDVLVVAGIEGISLPGLQMNALDAPVDSIGQHKINGGADDDIIVNVGGNDNTLLGGDGHDVIVSIGDATDTIKGGSGDDYIFGGSDNGNVVHATLQVEDAAFAKPDFENGDKLSGGDGADTFLYLPEGKIADGVGSINAGPLGNITSNGADTITDFKTETDKIGIFVDEHNDVVYGEDANFASFNDAATAASEFFSEGSEASDTIQAFFAAGVEGDGYLFIDDNADGGIDFAIKLQGLTDLSDFDGNDIDAIDVSAIIDTIGHIVSNSNLVDI